MKLPRDLTGQELAKALEKRGYSITRQTGSHIRLSTEREGEHHVTVPAHDPIKVGTLNGILRDVAAYQHLTREHSCWRSLEIGSSISSIEGLVPFECEIP